MMIELKVAALPSFSDKYDICFQYTGSTIVISIIKATFNMRGLPLPDHNNILDTNYHISFYDENPRNVKIGDYILIDSKERSFIGISNTSFLKEMEKTRLMLKDLKENNL